MAQSLAEGFAHQFVGYKLQIQRLESEVARLNAELDHKRHKSESSNSRDIVRETRRPEGPRPPVRD